MRLLFTVPGAPVAWQRTGFRPRGAKGTRFFTPERTREFEGRVWMACTLAARTSSREEPAGLPWDGPVAVRVHLYLPDARRRDLDNFAKSILDGLNSRPGRPRALADDSQVVELVLRKSIDREHPRTEVEIEQVELEKTRGAR
jgi:Holliday junction resolvase RusA-like endonuclease